MGLVLWLAVFASAAWVVWLWQSRARRVAVAGREARHHLALERGRPGALPSASIQVTSAATIEPIVEREPCMRCGGAMHVDQHEVEDHGGGRLRRVDARCGSCSRPTTTWFRVHVSLPN
ncbi:MAG: hypothetical protein KUG77_19075 [Nannocystaceae bacterium]|nr:hypothetical protein [Nannocystaceae bacterium]